MQLCALVATFMIAFFYELASAYHINLLSISLEKMTRLAKTDQLTGILNRREFFRQAGKRLKQNSEGTMLMIDLDDFKRINDTYGHAIGDMALKSLVQTIKSCIRESELFGRIGGEEFAVFLPLGLHDGYKRAETIRQAVSQIRFIRENVDLRLTISIGMTPVLRSDTHVSDVLNRADKGLYQAKEGGKNVTIIWNG
jgi:diguanylate cyclase (GGDEF)-like protein